MKQSSFPTTVKTEIHLHELDILEKEKMLLIEIYYNSTSYGKKCSHHFIFPHYIIHQMIVPQNSASWDGEKLQTNSYTGMKTFLNHRCWQDNVLHWFPIKQTSTKALSMKTCIMVKAIYLLMWWVSKWGNRVGESISLLYDQKSSQIIGPWKTDDCACRSNACSISEA